MADYRAQLDRFGPGAENEEGFQRSGYTKDVLTVAERDTSLGQIVGREFQRNAISGQNPNAITPQAAGQMSQDNAVLLQLNTELTAGKLLQNGPGYFNAVFFTQSNSILRSLLSFAEPAGQWKLDPPV